MYQFCDGEITIFFSCSEKMFFHMDKWMARKDSMKYYYL